jgi:hypothetical protein
VDPKFRGGGEFESSVVDPRSRLALLKRHIPLGESSISQFPGSSPPLLDVPAKHTFEDSGVEIAQWPFIIMLAFVCLLSNRHTFIVERSIQDKLVASGRTKFSVDEKGA